MMNAKQTYYILAGINILLLGGLVAAAFGIDSLLSGQAATLSGKRLEVATLEAQSSSLKGAKEDVAKYTGLATIAKSIVPQDKDQAQTVREIVKIAAKNGVKLGSITFPTSSLGQKTSGRSLSQLTPVVGIGGVYSLEITVQSDTTTSIPYRKFLAFLSALEHNRRTALVSNISLSPDSKNASNVNFTLTLDEYIKP